MSAGATFANGWAPVQWEPSVGSGERVTVGAVVRIDDVVTAHQIIRDDVLNCMYGKSAAKARVLIADALQLARLVMERDFRSGGVAIAGFFIGEPKYTEPRSVAEALTVCSLMHSSLAALDWFDELEEQDSPQSEETSMRFSTEVRNHVRLERPDLLRYFGRQAHLSRGGALVKFGFLTPAAAVHFSVLQPVRQPASVRDARARLFELARAKELATLRQAALVMAVPHDDDPTLGPKARRAVRENVQEIEREADESRLLFYPVRTASDAAARVIQIAA